jgi:hypothetical protein
VSAPPLAPPPLNSSCTPMPMAPCSSSHSTVPIGRPGLYFLVPCVVGAPPSPAASTAPMRSLFTASVTVLAFAGVCTGATPCTIPALRRYPLGVLPCIVMASVRCFHMSLYVTFRECIAVLFPILSICRCDRPMSTSCVLNAVGISPTYVSSPRGDAIVLRAAPSQHDFTSFLTYFVVFFVSLATTLCTSLSYICVRAFLVLGHSQNRCF